MENNILNSNKKKKISLHFISSYFFFPYKLFQRQPSVAVAIKKPTHLSLALLSVNPLLLKLTLPIFVSISRKPHAHTTIQRLPPQIMHHTCVSAHIQSGREGWSHHSIFLFSFLPCMKGLEIVGPSGELAPFLHTSFFPT